MWYVKSLEEFTCHYCDHIVLENQDRLTDFDGLISEGTTKEMSRHFHLRCEECRLPQSCYESYASEQTLETSDEELISRRRGGSHDGRRPWPAYRAFPWRILFD